MRVEIVSAMNGYEMTLFGDGDGLERLFVYQSESEETDVESLSDMLRALVDEIGPLTSRYSPKRLYIRVEPGDKYDSQLDQQ